VAGVVVALALCADEPGARRVAAELFPEAPLAPLTRVGLRPVAPFDGDLFALLARVPRGACVGLVVPVAWQATGSGAPGGAPPAGEPGAAAAPGLVAVADHVNLELRGPLTGRWPAGVPRSFPPLAGVYQPAVVRARGGPRVYSGGVVVAGVADARRLTPFEAAAIRGAGVNAVSDTLVPPAIVAAYHGLTLAACGVPRADDNDEG
jgi:hypothetical protein